MGVFQLPFLIGCVSLTFVTPQLLDLNTHGYFYIHDNSVELLHMCLCNMALAVGYNFVSKRIAPMSSIIRFEGGSRFEQLIYIFFLVGTIASIMNRGVYKGGFVSGSFVIISFFTNYASIALVAILIGYNRQIINRKIFIYIALAVVVITLDKIFASGRRAATINLVLTLLYFYLDKNDRLYRHFKYCVPAFFIVGMITTSQIGEYRNNAYGGKKNLIENIQSLDFSSRSQAATYEKGEIYNAFEGMRMVYDNGEYDFGATNWNGIIRNFVPTVIVSKETKNSLMFKNKSDVIVNYLTRSGSTMTGYFDSFLSFGMFGFIKFLIIGSLMGYLWRRRDQSDIALLLYCMLLVPGLHLLTHSSNYFVSELFYELIFVYPFLKIAITTEHGCVYEELIDN